MSLAANLDREPDRTTVSLEGDLDLATASVAEGAIAEAEQGSPALLVLDLSGLMFMDSNGLRLILSADRRARERGGTLAVTTGRPSIRRIFQTTGVEARLTFVDQAAPPSSPEPEAAMGPVPLLEFELAADAQAPAKARALVADIGASLPPAQVETLPLLLTELVTNSIRHAGEGGRLVRVRILSPPSGPALRVEVTDGGDGFEPRLEPAKPEADSGWGLRLVDALASRWGVHGEDGTTVWFELA